MGSVVLVIATLPALSGTPAVSPPPPPPPPAAIETPPPAAVSPVPFQDPGDRMPLGPAALSTTIGRAKPLATGVTYRRYTQGYATARWTVAVYLSTTRDDVVTHSPARAEKYRGYVTGAGLAATVVSFDPPPTADVPYRSGNKIDDRLYGVRSGRFATETAAADHLKRLRTVKVTIGGDLVGLRGVVEHEAYRDEATTGPWEVRALVVEPYAAVRAGGAHGTDVSKADTVRDIARNAGALAAVNGSDFDISSPNNPGHGKFDGDPIGIYVQDNALLSEAVNGRTALLLYDDAAPRITELTTAMTLTAPDGAQWQLDGVNRAPGRIANCGGTGGDLRKNGSPLRGDEPWRAETCTDADEIVLFRPEWGASTPTGPAGSVDVVVDGNWRAKAIRSPAGGPIPAGSRVLQGIGAGAQWLRSKYAPGRVFRPSTRILDPQGQRVTDPAFTAIAGGPALVRDGEVWINTGANGYRSATSVFGGRHPRTLAGITAAGQLLLVVIDGRRPGVSVGVTMPEAAAVMKWLGAVDAMMLGIGGDSTLTIGDTLTNRPTDHWGHEPVTERRVGNAIVLTPK
ncbi:hypothetical protein ACTI_50000 [Actinoplanes sp. OR16]|uniref:phosphodiester glycosidase family protein n=1 Tax=Actinoplanes sp. OR16 TaxID=946334 RepID=UPI000F702EB8|nr:phosphodiester glycosidase family protein [Actinoplanes sp. OR16]BBH68315.1 hypothetical protein ACTI_50000 [Actinoplanes sp. OR16]